MEDSFSYEYLKRKEGETRQGKDPVRWQIRRLSNVFKFSSKEPATGKQVKTEYLKFKGSLSLTCLLPVTKAKIKCSGLASSRLDLLIWPPTSISSLFSFKTLSHLAQVFYKTLPIHFRAPSDPAKAERHHMLPFLSHTFHLPTQ